MSKRHDSYCAGCAIPERDRINLPEKWQEGDPVGKQFTRHSTAGDPRVFVFRGDPAKQDRVYL